MRRFCPFGTLAIAIFVVLSTGFQQTSPAAEESDSLTQHLNRDHNAANPQKWRLLAVGDIMSDWEVVRTAEARVGEPDAGPGGYSWAMRNVQQRIHDADLAMGNLEFPVNPQSPVRGRSPFNGSPLLLDALKDAGFDILFLANNHLYDERLSGSETTLSEVEKRGFHTLGVSRSDEQRKELLIVDIGDEVKLRVGFLNFTRGISDEDITYNLEHLIFGQNINYAILEEKPRFSKELFRQVARVLFPSALIPTRALFLDTVERNVAMARADGAEYVVAFLHWGNWPEHVQDAGQIALAQAMCDLGVDAVIGAGPHVIQPVEIRKSAAGGDCLVAYSLGNFLSKSLTNNRPVTGMILELDIEKSGNEVTLIDHNELITRNIQENENPQDAISIIRIDRSEYQKIIQD